MRELIDLEDELKFMETDKEHRSYKEVIDNILDAKKTNREYSEG